MASSTTTPDSDDFSQTSTVMAMATTSPEQSESESDPDSKPIIILVSTYEVLGFNRRFSKLLARLRREARLIRVTNSDMFDAALVQYEEDIHGIIVTDASIMQPAHEDLSQRLSSVLRLPFNDWAILFAFDFPLQVAGKAHQFARYMRRVFQLDWKISGVSFQKVELELRERALSRLGSREYRWYYEMRAVFLRHVSQEDKILVVKGSVQEEDKDEDEDEDGDEEMDDHYGTEHDNNEREYGDEDGYENGDETNNHNGGSHGYGHYYFDDASTESSQSTTTTNGPFRPIHGDPTLITDSPVVWHEFRSDDYDYDNDDDDNYDDDDNGSPASQAVGYLGFVGHVEDERQLAGLILGMCAIVPGGVE